MTPVDVINHQTTGTRAIGYTPLHYASEASDKDYRRVELVRELLVHRANLELKTKSGNTPLLCSSGTGVSDIMTALMDARADVTATNNKGKGVVQKAAQSSGTSRQQLARSQVEDSAEWVQESGRTRGDNVSEARHARILTSQANSWWEQRGGERDRDRDRDRERDRDRDRNRGYRR